MTQFYAYLVLGAAILYTVGLIMYTPAPWYKSWGGRALWSLLLSTTLISWLVTASYFLGNFAGREVARGLIYTLVFLNSVIVVVSIFTALNNGRKGYGTRRDTRDRVSDHLES